MRTNIQKLLSALLLSVCLVPAAFAHHSFAVHFVADKLVEIKGTVTGFRFSNPHGILTLNVTEQDGTVVEWRAETNSPNVLKRRGWSKDSIKPREEVTIIGFPTRDGTPYMRISKVIFADGHELIGQGSNLPVGDAD